jgi:hypothetical protein
MPRPPSHTVGPLAWLDSLQRQSCCDRTVPSWASQNPQWCALPSFLLHPVVDHQRASMEVLLLDQNNHCMVGVSKRAESPCALLAWPLNTSLASQTSPQSPPYSPAVAPDALILQPPAHFRLISSATRTYARCATALHRNWARVGSVGASLHRLPQPQPRYVPAALSTAAFRSQGMLSCV